MIVRMNTFGDRLKSLRLERGLTGTELGEVFNFSRSGVSNWEIRNREPSLEVLKQLASYFNVSTDYLIGFSDERYPIVSKETDDFMIKLVPEAYENNLSEWIDNKDDLLEMLKNWKCNSKEIDESTLNITKLPEDMNRTIITKSMKVSEPIYKLFSNVCSKHDNYKKQDLLSLALYEFCNRYK